MSNIASRLGLTVVNQTSKVPTGTVIFLHGSGDNGRGILAWIKGLMKNEFVFSQLRVLYPSAPMMPYSLYGGQASNVWFDRLDLSIAAPDHLQSIDAMAGTLKELIQSEVDAGIPMNRIVVGGFSMGGAMSLHLGYRFVPQVAGVFGLSCFLNEESLVYKVLGEEGAAKPPLFMAHGEDDGLVPATWGRSTHTRLAALGVPGPPFLGLPATDHELHKKELKMLYNWLLDCLPVISA